MPADIAPPELARLVDFAERPHAHDWSLRSALVRYAQPQPERVEKLLDVVRRIEWALKPHTKLLERDGQRVWNLLVDESAPAEDPDTQVVGLLRAAADVDRLGDVLAVWAADRTTPHPDDDVDAVTADVAQRLDALGVPREEGPPPTRRRG